MADDKDDGSISYVKAAFHWQYNLDRAGRRARFRASSPPVACPCCWPPAGADLPQHRAAERPFPAPGRPGNTPSRSSRTEEASATCSANCRRKCAAATPGWMPFARPSAKTTSASPAPRRCSPSRWKKLDGLRNPTCACCNSAFHHRRISASPPIPTPSARKPRG